MQRIGSIATLARFVAAACTSVLPAMLSPAVLGQPTGPRNPPLVIASMSGRDLFQFYCGPCHGRDGKGGGPAAKALKQPPPDLTTIAARSGGAFPAALVTANVTGDADRPMPAHGSKEMPVWGPIFRGLDRDDAKNRVRVANLVAYIESIQSKEQ